MGGSFKDARIFRSRELANLTGEEAAFLSGALGIATIYDLRTASEVAAHPEPCLLYTSGRGLHHAAASRGLEGHGSDLLLSRGSIALHLLSLLHHFLHVHERVSFADLRVAPDC